GLEHARMVVPEDERAPGADKIEITVAVDIEEIRAFSPSNKERLASHSAKGPCRTIDSPGDDFAGTLKGQPAMRTAGIESTRRHDNGVPKTSEVFKTSEVYLIR